MSDIPQPKVSIIVLNAFTTFDLEQCLQSLRSLEYRNYEIILVDYKTPNISQIINNIDPKIRLISLTGNDIGPSAMHNIGIAQSDPQSKYIAFLDNDTVVEKKWLLELVYAMEYDDNIAATQSKILLYENPNMLNTCGNKSNFLAVGWPDGLNTPNNGHESPINISFPSGAACLFRKSILKQIGSFDETYFIYVDDLDVGLRAILAGYRILFCPRSIAYHKYHFLRGRRSYYYLNRNRLRTFFKIYDARTYFLMVPSFCLYEVFVFGHSLLFGATKELIHAYLDNLADLKNILIKRKHAQRIKIIKDKALVQKLEGEIAFNEISNISIVKLFLNPFLKKYHRLLINIL